MKPYDQRGFWDNWEGDWKPDRPTARAFAAVWILAALLGLSFWGVVIWAIIKVVNHYA